MFALPVQIETVLVAFAPVFSQPVWHHAKLLILGAILARGKRTVTSALRIVGLAQERHFTNYHRVLNRAVWHGWFAAKVLLGLLVAQLPPGSALQILVDETIERRNGSKIKTKGVFRDAVRSSRSKVAYCYGLRWVAMMLLVPVPWSRRPWALPFYTVQAPSEKTCRKLGKPHKSVIDHVCFAVRLARRWLPKHTLILSGDGAYSVIELIQCCRSFLNPVILVARFRWNAALNDFPPAPIPGKRGRKPQKGKRQPSLKQRLDDPATVWENLYVHWYQEGTHEVLACSDISLWYTPGKPPVPIRWVIVRDPHGKFEDTPILCTDLDATVQQIIEWFVRRWNIEVTFEELRAHLGMETQRQWSDRAIARTTPALFGLFSLVTLMAVNIIKNGQLPVLKTAWYRKEQATFSDIIALVRRTLWTARYSVNSLSQAQSTEFLSDFVNHLLGNLSEAA
jgi:hypothetical protein